MYAPKAKVTHLVSNAGPFYASHKAICGKYPPNEWRGTGSQDEYDEAKRRPLCKRCAEYVTVPEGVSVGTPSST